MPRQKLPHITPEQWNDVVAAYELGHLSQRQIARILGVSPATVCRKMKSRDAVKASRICEVIEALNAELDLARSVRCQAEAAEWDAKLEQFQRTTDMVGRMVQAIIMADQLGDTTLAKPVVASVKDAVSERP